MFLQENSRAKCGLPLHELLVWEAPEAPEQNRLLSLFLVVYHSYC